jgi:hypothetical protein
MGRLMAAALAILLAADLSGPGALLFAITALLIVVVPVVVVIGIALIVIGIRRLVRR